MKAKRVVSFVLLMAVALTSVCFTSCGFFGGESKDKVIKEWKKEYKSVVEMDLEFVDSSSATTENQEAVKKIIGKRLELIGKKTYKIFIDTKKNEIAVCYPSAKEEDAQNVKDILHEIGSESILTFRPGNSYKESVIGPDGYIYKTPTGETEEVLLDGGHIKSAAVKKLDNSDKKEYAVEIKLDKEGSKKFADITEKYLGQIVSIWVVDTMVSAPTVQSVITGGSLQVTGSFSKKDANKLAQKINAGVLPVELKTKQYSVG